MEQIKKACESKPESSMVISENEFTEQSFYEKLIELNDSSGLNLIFNVRETKFDLHFLYKEVTNRGGFYQVKKDEKWDEVESALNLKSSEFIQPTQLQKEYSEFMLPAQLQNFYEIHLLPFEKVYWKRTNESDPCSDATFSAPLSIEVAKSCSTGKRKKAEKQGKITDDTCDVGTGGRKKENLSKKKRQSLNTNDKESYAPPTKPRTGYQIFLRLESHRLKLIRGETVGDQKSRDMAVQSWNSLSDEGKKPYNDASKLDKERYEREMEEYSKCGGKNENTSSDCLRDNDDPCSLHGKSNYDKRDNSYRVSFLPSANCEVITLD